MARGATAPAHAERDGPLRLPHLIAIALLLAAVGAMLTPTSAGGIANAIAFQRTDIAALTLGAACLAIGLAAVGASLVALAASVGSAAIAAAGFLPVAANPQLGALAPVLLFAPAAAAIVFSAYRRFQAIQGHRQALAEGEDKTVADPIPPEIRQPPAATAPPETAATRPAEAAARRDTARAMFESDASELFGGAPPRDRPNSGELADPDALERMQLLRMRASQAGYSEQAIEFWHKLYQEFPDYYPALNSEARVLFQRGRLTEARARLKRSLEIAPDEETTLRLAAGYAGRDNAWDEAAQLWERLAAVSDLAPDGLSSYIKALVQAGRAEEGRARFHRYNEMHPNNGRLYAAGGFAAEVLEEYDEAYELWRGAMALEPAAFSHRRRAIHVLTKLGRFSEAAEMTAAYKIDAANEPEAAALADQVLEAAIADGGSDATAALAMLGAEDPSAWAQLIKARLKNDDIVGAEEAFQTAVAKDLATPDVLRAGADAAGQASRPDVAAERWSALAELLPEDVEASSSAAFALDVLGARSDAKSFVAQALAIDPQDERALRVQASIAAKEDDWSTALDAWKMIGGQAGLDEEVVLGCAVALHGLGRVAEADMLVERGIAELGRTPELLAVHARLAEAKPDVALAVDRWRAIATAAPQDAAGWRGLIRTLSAMEDHPAAEAALDQGMAAVSDIEDLKASPHVQRLLGAREGVTSPPSTD